MGGLSGAFLLLPFQVSVLGFAGPAVSPTNLLFNIVAIPSGVLRYRRERRMLWPLAWTIVITTLPGLCIGAFIRIKYLPDARSFKLFAAAVLLYIGVRLCLDLVRRKGGLAKPGTAAAFHVTNASMGLKALRYDFDGDSYRLAFWKLFLLSFTVGIIGGIYGIGGGAIIAPFLVAAFRLPVHSVAGACLFGTLIGSVGGVAFYALASVIVGETSTPVSPDWLLGLLFGIGGSAGMYVGARLQRFFPARAIKAILVAAVLFVVVKYVLEFLR